MPRPKKDDKILHIPWVAPVYDKLEQFCEESGMTKTVAIERGLSQFFEPNFKRPVNERKRISIKGK